MLLCRYGFFPLLMVGIAFWPLDLMRSRTTSVCVLRFSVQGVGVLR
jgi:hypothetical protein